MAKFKQLEQQPDFIANEKKLLDEWYSSGLVDKYLHKNDGSEKYYSFLDGPITANNPMGVHHAWGRTYKDLWQRLKNMQGFRQRFQNGFDCQGLWVEVEVEKELGLKSKRDIENLVPGDPKASMAKFIQLCKDRVEKYSQMQTQQSKRLGYFMDWDHSYFTMSEENNYIIWTFLKKCHERGLIYKGHDSVPWCPRCGTAISQHEMLTEDYKEATHETVYVRFPIVGEENTYLMIWTTTPWTLPANVAVAVDPEKEYALVEDNGTYYMGKAAVDRMGLKAKKVIKGKELVGKEYTSPFDHLPRVSEALKGENHKVIATNTLVLPISDEEGTGLVHIATGAGVEDFKLGKELGIPVIEVIDEGANYLEGMEEFTSQNAKNKPEIIIDYIKEKGNLFYQEKITHRYPACWRCKSELVWRVVDEWYISMDPLREPMKEATKKINWLPEFGLKRELDWLDNMHDWLISKKRYWGLALPIWVCSECDAFDVIGDREELQERAVEGWDKFEGNTPHRPFIDEIKVECKKCGKLMERIPDVGNPWLDAGIVPFSTISKDNQSTPLYKKNKEEWRKWYPVDFITESFPGQFKNWFYSLIAMSTVLENENPTKTILGFATLLAEDGRAMHKSWGNSIEFNEGADKIGVDIMRWMFAKQDPASNMLFGFKMADETRRRFFLILWNSFKFFTEYARNSDWEPKGLETVELTVLDRWVLSRLNNVNKQVTLSLEKYDSATAARVLEEFIVQDLSTWYIRRSRDRVGAKGVGDEHIFFETMYHVWDTTSRLLAPFMPFISETMYSTLHEENSVHLSDWPEVEENRIDDKLEMQMDLIRKAAEKGHAQRKEKQIAVRQPLGGVSVLSKTSGVPEDGLLRILSDELNIKSVNWGNSNNDDLTVELDTNMTPELEEEGKTRDLARQIQDERKKLGTSLTAKVSVTSPWIPQNPELVEWVKKRTLAEELVEGDKLQVTELK
jgi:isoleucyl-tRNA synthetase